MVDLSAMSALVCVQSFIALLRDFWTLRELITTTTRKQLEWRFGTRLPGKNAN